MKMLQGAQANCLCALFIFGLSHCLKDIIAHNSNEIHMIWRFKPCHILQAGLNRWNDFDKPDPPVISRLFRAK